ncbi:glutamate 5-kinase [Sphingobacterium hotanense]|uniref:glutamate 5-kinase n=1 Tax=Sphingobacterium hotanense TaxID=649196 RepID=UPI0021A3D991|nr:glutamate 5-kinase [Sphingobacterium hotanense]MCT1525920.1 glutamate 5-kinase [Sphingobacterium hotanense]
MKKPVLVVKFGSASITSNGEIDEQIVLEIARQCAQLQPKYNIVLVSSGAVAAGKRFIPKYTGTLAQRKAAAAIGNPLLVRTYGTYFRPFKIALAQSLCERQHFANRSQFLQLKSTYETLWKNNIIPIANENDVVSNKELKFSDNDELATLIAVGFGAEQVLFGTSVPGVLDGKGNVIPEIKVIDKEALSLARKEKSSVGLGGMTSKLNFARLANQLGIKAVIFSMQTENAILKAVKGETGTVCHPQKTRVSSRNKWLASGSLIAGMVQVDKGAIEALLNRKSLLAVGIKQVLQDFEVGEVFQIADEEGVVQAVAKSKIDSVSLKSGSKKNMEIAHANDIVLL